jgi:ABC-2 type transport system permease protein
MIRYYWTIIKRVAAISFSSMLAYRSNVIFFFLFESFFLAANMGGMYLGVQLAGGQLAGWSLNEVMFVSALYGVGHQLFLTLFMGGLFNTGFFVWSGRMDYVLLKPLHPLLGMHAANEFVISNIPNLIINVGILIAFYFRLVADGATFSIWQILGLKLFFLAGLAVRYGIALIVVAPAFFAEKLAEGEDAYWSLQSLAKYPTGVFPRVMQWVFSFILPLATIAAVPAEALLGRQSLAQGLAHLSISIVFSWLTVKFYELGARRYQSVNTGA